MRYLLPCPPCGRQGRPDAGFLAGSNTSEPRGSAPRERDHRGGDHPVPSRTRQLSPPSPRVLQRQAAGGQGVALAEGAFLSAPRRPAGGCPLAGLSAFGAGFCLAPLQPGCCDSRFAISSADPCSRGACPQRLVRLPESREAVADGSGGHPSALRRRGAGPLIVHRWRMGALHAGSACSSTMLRPSLWLCFACG